MDQQEITEINRSAVAEHPTKVEKTIDKSKRLADASEEKAKLTASQALPLSWDLDLNE